MNRRLALRKEYVEQKHKRDAKGHWATTNSSGGSTSDDSAPKQQAPAEQSSASTSAPAKEQGGKKSGKMKGDGTKESPFQVSDVDQAAKLLGEGHHVSLKQGDQVATLLDKLKTIVDDARAKGEKAPVYDLCKVSVPKTNLFCAESKGVPRVKMPQLSGVPIPGSKADKLPKNDKGEVDLGAQFMKHLQSQNVKITQEEVPADQLRASQNELNGGKVAGIADGMAAGKVPEARIFVADDGYVVDGHHRWAAKVGLEYKTGKPSTQQVNHIHMDIISVLKSSNDFAKEWGIPQASVAKSKDPACVGCNGENLEPTYIRHRITKALGITKAGDKQGHPFRGNQHTRGRSAGARSKISVDISSAAWESLMTPDGGFTISTVTGEQPVTGFAVAVRGKSSITPVKEFFSGPKGKEKGRKILNDWLKEHAEVFDDPEAHVGAWHDAKNNEICLDPSIVVADRSKAIKRGIKNNQQSIADLSAIAAGDWDSAFIDTGGTGDRETGGKK